MVDWPGLLKWSLKYQDNTSSNPNMKPMDEATKKWLTEALEDASVDHVKRMKEIISELPTSENPEILLENLFDLIENLDAGLVFCQIGGMPVLLQTIYSNKNKKARFLAAQIFQSIVQNSLTNQVFALETGAFKLIERILNEEELENKEAAFSALSAFIRGEALEIKRQFIETDGIELIRKIYKEFSSEKILQKSIFLLKDLVYYDENLDKLSINKSELAVGGEKFKGIVKKKIFEDEELLKLMRKQLTENSKINIENRIAVLYIFGEMVNIYKKELLLKLENWRSLFETHLKEIIKENEKSDGIFDNEAIVLKELIKKFENV